VVIVGGLTLHAHAFDHVRSEEGEDGAFVVTSWLVDRI